MKINLLDINEYIKKNDIKPVTSTRVFISGKKFDPEGLFSEKIFGRYGSKERRRTFGYIQLPTKIIHPEAWNLVLSLDQRLKKLSMNQNLLTVDHTGKLMESDDPVDSGVAQLVKILKNIDFDQFKNKEIANFVKKNLDKIIIDKILVLPAGIRDVIISKMTSKTMIQYSDIVNLYSRLIYVSTSSSSNLPAELLNSITNTIQKIVLEINNWIYQNKYTGKSGLIRGNLLKKRVDYSADLVIKPDPTLPMGYVGLPWQIALKLFELFVIYKIFNENRQILSLIQNEMGLDNEPSTDDLLNYFKSIVFHPETVNPELKDQLIDILSEVVKDKVVLYKRDPVENRDSILAANIRIEKDGYGMTINPLDFPRTGGDADGDTYKVFPLFTKNAIEQAKQKFHPKYSKEIWTSVSGIDSFPYSIELNAAAAIYRATSE